MAGAEALGAQAAKTYDAVAKGYESDTSGARWVAYDHLTWRRITLTAPPPESGVAVLDAGGGGGKWATRLASAGYEVVLVDPSQGMLDAAREKLSAAGQLGRVRLSLGEITALDFPDDSFGFVLCEGDPLSYCIGREALAARELVRVAKPGAGILVGCDNRFHHALGALITQRDPRLALEVEATGSSQDPYKIPVHAFTPTELRSLFEGAGAVVETLESKSVLLQFCPTDVLAKWYADDDLRRDLLAFEERLAAEPTLNGMGSHLQMVARKRAGVFPR